MILTGRSLWRIPKNLRALEPPPGVPLLPSLIAEAGYATFHSGKPDNACRYANAQFQTNIESGKNRNSAIEHADNVLKFLAAQRRRQAVLRVSGPARAARSALGLQGLYGTLRSGQADVAEELHAKASIRQRRVAHSR